MERRGALLGRLELLNDALDRRRVPPLVTVEEGAALPTDNLRAMVGLTADRVVTVNRAMAGTP